jgi:hypothetical protein
MFARQKGKCFYCERQMKPPRLPFHGYDGLAATREHRIPRSRGGGNGRNVVLACADCNSLKGNLTETEFAVAVYLAEARGVNLKRNIPAGGFAPIKSSLLASGLLTYDKGDHFARSLADKAAVVFDPDLAARLHVEGVDPTMERG